MDKYDLASTLTIIAVVVVVALLMFLCLGIVVGGGR